MDRVLEDKSKFSYGVLFSSISTKKIWRVNIESSSLSPWIMRNDPAWKTDWFEKSLMNGSLYG